MIWVVEEPRMPSLSSSRPTDRPPKVRSTRKALKSSLSIFAKTM
jgi:hypothetical protein